MRTKHFSVTFIPNTIHWKIRLLPEKVKVKVLVTQSCLTLCKPMHCGPPSSSVHGILQARMLEWIAMRSSRGSSQPRNQTQVSHIAGRFFTAWATREVQLLPKSPSPSVLPIFLWGRESQSSFFHFPDETTSVQRWASKLSLLFHRAPCSLSLSFFFFGLHLLLIRIFLLIEYSYW